MAIMSLTCLILISALFRSGAGAEVVGDGAAAADTGCENHLAAIAGQQSNGRGIDILVKDLLHAASQQRDAGNCS